MTDMGSLLGPLNKTKEGICSESATRHGDSEHSPKSTNYICVFLGLFLIEKSPSLLSCLDSNVTPWYRVSPEKVIVD